MISREQAKALRIALERLGQPQVARVPSTALDVARDGRQVLVAHEPRRPRKLLLHRRELRKLETAVTRGGLTMVPLQLYFTDGRAKVEMALARGRKRHDKREALKGKAAEQEIRRASRR